MKIPRRLVFTSQLGSLPVVFLSLSLFIPHHLLSSLPTYLLVPSLAFLFICTFLFPCLLPPPPTSLWSFTLLPIFALSPFLLPSLPLLSQFPSRLPAAVADEISLLQSLPSLSLHIYPPPLTLCIHHSCPSGFCSALIRSLSVAFSPRQCLPFSLGLCK